MPSSHLRLAALLTALLVAGRADAAPPELQCAQGLARYQAGALREAAALLRTCATSNVAAAHYLGLALLRTGQLGDGRRALSAAARLDAFAAYGGASRLLLDLGLAYLAERNTVWAARVLGQARELAPDDRRIRYHLGVALLGAGETAGAADELTRAVDGVDRHLSAAERDPARLRLGLALYLSGRWEESRRRLGEVGVRRDVARNLMRAAYEAEGLGASWISAELSVGAVVDSNPLYDHERTAPTALGPLVSGGLVFRPWVDSRNLLWGELSGARSFYFASGDPPADRDPRDATPSELRAAAFYLRRLSLGERFLHLSAGYTFGLTFLDGPPPLADAHHIFLEEHSGHVALQRPSSGGVQSQLRLSAIRSRYADLARCNWGTELSFEHGASFLGERLRLLGWLTFRHETAQSTDYSTNIPGLGLGGSFVGPLALVLGLRLGYDYRTYYDSAGGRWGVQRLDHTLAFAAEIGRALPHALRLRANYQRLQNFSSVTSFDYSRDLFTLALSWSTS
jgi:tetratricopeptide (TPR) repeat protein